MFIFSLINLIFDVFILSAVFLILYVLFTNLSCKKAYEQYLRMRPPRPFLRTPDERFADLPGYDFEPHYVDIDGLRMHYVDEGPRDADPVLLMHGEPSWCYLYRKMIPIIVKAGHRVIAPDLIGFGRSDKLVKRSDYSHRMHVDMVAEFVKKLGLKDITLFCQDWGGLIGLRVVADHKERFARIVAGNTALPGKPPTARNGEKVPLLPLKSLLGFVGWLIFSQFSPIFTAGRLLQLGTSSKLPPDVVAAYDAPFPDRKFLAGARVFPVLVPGQVIENTRAWKVLAQWDKPFLTTFADSDPILGGGDRIFQAVVPGAQGQPHTTIKNASHFLQEDKGEELAEIVVDFIKRTTQRR